MSPLAKTYEPQEVENHIYDFWIKNRYFHTVPDAKKKPYTIVMPPPNITGKLHMGHALDNTLQDILIRFRRMQGYAALWMPGTDHASIATEAKIVEAMRKEGVTKEDIGREGFLERAWQWKKEYGGTIISQLKKMGSSCDWERERFTMDEGCSKAVREVFCRLYEKKLIYRGERIINWCPHCKTSISDAEVEYSERDGSFWHIRYPLTDGSGSLELATTRPETLLGDTAVAVHPDDERYRHLIGKTVILPLVGKEIPIVGDTYVEQDFGTGVVKITPAHDPNDFEVGLRHNLPVINVMDESGVINENGGVYQGLDRYEARDRVVEDLDKQGYLVKVEPMKHNVGECYRCHTIVEPRVSLQWFVKMKPLAEPAIAAVREGKTRFVPERFDKIYYHWMENIKDWCISRQLWWGHRIPAYYCDACGEVVVAREAPGKCPKCGCEHLSQDNDTLDTWFSSALWPFSTLGWPDNTEELRFFYPTNTLVTGYDIIFFWVARMIFSAVEQTGQAPFDTVFIHGIVRDSQGRKMSKSLGNGIDPLEVISEFGADALRFTLATGNSPGNDMRYMREKVESSRNFANKLWNAARFILMNLEGHEVALSLPDELTMEEKWLVSRLNALTKEVTDNLEKFELGIAVQKLYDFIWDIFCDWYIELAKIRLQADESQAENTRRVLVWAMDTILRLLHPFMPFITEEIWQTIPHDGEALMLADWPVFMEERKYEAQEREFERVMDVIRAIRTRRSEMNIAPSRKARIYIETPAEETFRTCAPFLLRLAYGSELKINEPIEEEKTLAIVTADAKVLLPMGELIDFAAERARLNKELETAKKNLAQVEAKLSNEAFVSRAPQQVVDVQREQARKLNEKISMLLDSMERLAE